MKPPREMTATEVSAARYAACARVAAAADALGCIRTPLRASGGVYDEEDVRLFGTVPAAGHNPAGLTVAQVGVGWRLLAPGEIRGKGPPELDRKDIEAWERGSWDTTGWSGDSDHKTYRTAKPPGFFLPATVEYRSTITREALGAAAATTGVDEKVREALGAAAAPDARRYVHTFVCNACPRTCTMETVTRAPGPLVPGGFDMQCPFRRPEFTAIWKSGPVQTLIP